MSSYTILAISGSLRSGSLNRALLRASQELLPDGVELVTADIDLPLYNWDVEQSTGFPAAVAAFRKQLAEADGLLIATPEYNYSMPGALKNALDWASRGGADSPLTGIPVAIMGVAGRLGSVRAQMHLRTVLLHNDTNVVQRPEVLISGRDSFQDGALVDERGRDQIKRLVKNLVAKIETAKV